MEAYLNELSLSTHSGEKALKDNFITLGECLRKLSEWSITTIRVSPDFYLFPFLHEKTFFQLLNDPNVFPDKNKEEEVDFDLKTLLTGSLGVRGT